VNTGCSGRLLTGAGIVLSGVNMCAIAGIINSTSRPVGREVLERMTASMRHRGPDAAGVYVEDNIGLGHCRLAIIDLATGDQPMQNQGATIAITFNGEIYNYIELRKELESLGRKFKTDSDTEVALQAYEEWGIECQSRFNGMWAFAIWDSRNKSMFLSRDRCGEKPLYYSNYNGSFYFGSEAKSLLKAGVPDDKNLEYLELYLTLGYIPAPYSFYKCINKLQPGHYIIVRENHVAVKQYWSFPQIAENEMRTDMSRIYEEFNYLLRDSVEIRMRCDVPFGAFLSGGMDSASIVALMSDVSDYPVETFTIGFDEKGYDERELASSVAKKYQTNHREFTVDKDDFDNALESTLYHYDEPFGDSSAIPTGYVSSCASKHVKMVLTGDGGDEVLSGYKAYGGEKIATLYQMIPSLIQRSIPTVVRKIGSAAGGGARYKLNRAAGALSASGMSFVDRLIYKSAWVPPATVRSMMVDCGRQYDPRDYVNDVFSKCGFNDPFYKLMYFQFNVSLPERMLTKVDRMSMAHSLETRVPFLDYRLVELMAGVSKKVKMPGLDRKAVLKNTIGRSLPDALFSAPKRGFRIPLREWFKDDIFSDRLSGITGSEMCLKEKVITDVFDANRTGKQDCGNFIWMLFLLDRWLSQSNSGGP